jgi:hypothetical protein
MIPKKIFSGPDENANSDAILQLPIKKRKINKKGADRRKILAIAG